MKQVYKILSVFLALFSLFSFSPASAEGNPFVPTTDTMGTGLTPMIGGGSLFSASQNIANFTDITGAYYDSSLNRIVFIGKTDGSGPKFNKDDMAVAIQSIFFNGTMPNVDISDDPNNPSGPNSVVTYTGPIKNTNLGSVLFNSDYKLKQYVIGYDPSNVKITSTVPSYKSVVDRYVALNGNPIPGNQTKFLLSPQNATLKNATAEKAFVFTNLSMQVVPQHLNPANDVKWNQAASEFATDLTTNYDQYAQETASLAQAKQIGKIVSILKWFSDKNISTDLQWAQNYTAQTASTPTSIQKVKTPAFPNGYTAQGQVSYTTPNTYIQDDGIAASLKSSSQAVSTAKEDITWTFTNGGQQYQAVSVSAEAFKSLGGYATAIADFSTPIAGDLALSFVRTYSSFDNGQSGMGIGWDFLPARIYPNSTLQDLDVITCNNILYFSKLAIDTDFGHETFTFNCPAGYTPDDPSFHSKLTQNLDESFTVTSSDQTKIFFNVDFQLTAIQDKNGNKINYSYDGSGKLTSIADTKSHQLTISYNPQNLISQVTDWSGRKVEYLYDTNGRLTGVKDPNGNTTNYTYDSNSRLLTITDRTGTLVLTNTYNPDGRISTQKDAAGLVKTNSFDTTNKLITQTDTNGRTVKTTYDSKSRILQQTDALGKSMLYTYSAEAVPLTQTDKNGVKTIFTYDSRGNVTSVTFPDNKSATYTYDNNNRITKVIDNRYEPTPKQVDYTYDTSGNQTQKSEAGIITKFTYDPTGEMLTFVDPLNRTTTFTRDTLGNKLTEKDPLNNVITYEYDPLGRLKKTTDADGRLFSQAYDNNGNILTLTNAAGITTNVYDKENRLLKVTFANNSVYQYGYNPSGSLISVIDPLNSVTSYGYDIYQNLTTQTDALNRSITYDFDQLNRQMQEKTALNKVLKWEYDANGNVTKRVDALNRSTSYQYNAFNRLIKVTYPDAKTVTHEYDSRGNRIKMIDTMGTSTYIYDNFDRLTQVTNPFNKTIKYEYDNADNLIKLTYPDNKVVTYTYDNNNRMLSVKDWNNKITTYTYNKNGSLATRVYPNTISTKYTYDSANRIIDVEHKKGTKIAMKLTYLRDSVGNVTKVTPIGSFMSIPHPTTYTYDALGRVTAQASEDREGNKVYTYDKVGNMLVKSNEAGTPIPFTYDADNRLLTKKDPTFGTFTQTYDDNGNLIVRRDVNSVKNLTYDFDNRLTKYGTDTFRYDGDGNRLEYMQSFPKRFVNDVSGQLSRVLVETDEDNTIENWIVYGLGVVSEGDATAGWREYYLEDGLGNSKALTSSSGLSNRIAYYEAFGNIEWGDENTYGFDGQEFDDTTGLNYMRARYYDSSIGRFITKDPVKGILTNPQTQNAYAFSLNNPVNLSDPSGEIAFVPVLLVAWGIAELGLTAADLYDLANTLQDPNVSTYDKAWSGGLVTLGILGPGAGYGKGLKVGKHILGQLSRRGWSNKLIKETISNPARTLKVHDVRHLPGGGKRNDPATAFIRKDGSYVIRNDKTGDIVQVSDRSDPNWKAPWDK